MLSRKIDKKETTKEIKEEEDRGDEKQETIFDKEKNVNTYTERKNNDFNPRKIMSSKHAS